MTTLYGILHNGRITYTAWIKQDLLIKAGLVSLVDPDSIVERVSGS